MEDNKHTTIKRIMAKRCDWCPACRWARANPEAKIAKVIAFHGKYCPFWQAWQDVYGDQQGGAEGSSAGS
ncbi:MAG: hypothetical protein JRI68_11715 [Deltaproteobacteria bacterium]|nr:hypothetical protein [Deltaproteobacteria bacterium]